MVNIAIDGPAGAGKSTVARGAAKALGYIYVDTGALYRTVALYVLQNGHNVHDSERVKAALADIRIELKFVGGVQRVYLNGQDVSEEIRTPEVSMGASAVAALPCVREFLFEQQRRIAREKKLHYGWARYRHSGAAGCAGESVSNGFRRGARAPALPRIAGEGGGRFV